MFGLGSIVKVVLIKLEIKDELTEGRWCSRKISFIYFGLRVRYRLKIVYLMNGVVKMIFSTKTVYFQNTYIH